MYQAALDGSLFAYLTDSFKQAFMTITGDAFDLNAELWQVFQVFLKLFVPFAISKPVKLSELDRVVPVEDQAQVIVEISSVDQKVDTLGWVNTKDRLFGQTIVQITDQCPCRITTLFADLFDGLPADNPIFEPNEFVLVAYPCMFPDKQQTTCLTLITLLPVLLAPFNNISALAG